MVSNLVPQDRCFTSQPVAFLLPHCAHPRGVFPEKWNFNPELSGAFCAREVSHPSRAAEGGNPRNSQFRLNVTKHGSISVCCRACKFAARRQCACHGARCRFFVCLNT